MVFSGCFQPGEFEPTGEALKTKTPSSIITPSYPTVQINETAIEFRDATLFYEDFNGVQHSLPGYTRSNASNGTSSTIVIDGQTIWYKISTTDFNVFDGNITFRENNSTGPVIDQINYIELGTYQINITGENQQVFIYRLMVDELLANMWLFFDRQAMQTKYNKYFFFYGTDTTENTYPNYDFYVPHNSMMPPEYGGDVNYTSNEFFVAHFSIDEDSDSGGQFYFSHDMNFFIDTGTGNLIQLPNEQLSSYWYEADYDQGTKFLDEDPATPYPSSAYTSYGSFIELVNQNYTAMIPENLVVRCSNGTPSGECSGLNYCSNGEFVSACQYCGCPLGQTCKKIGGTPTCVSGTDPIPVDR